MNFGSNTERKGYNDDDEMNGTTRPLKKRTTRDIFIDSNEITLK